ncbi:MAG TPA: HAD family phosphatase [Chitinophagaceae bacterium]|nr:HAD family phosphatase [Chitinophagaceae bacterium]
MSSSNLTINNIIFDLGGVLIDWNPYYLYRKIFTKDEEIAEFLAEVCTPQWNEEQDAGRPLAVATELMIQLHPSNEPEIRAYYGRWQEMLGNHFEDTVTILEGLKKSGKYHLYALTNWSAETFPVALERYNFLSWFEGIVVSGTEMTRKPFPEIFQIILKRYHISPETALLIDDSLRNLNGAKYCGISGIHFQSAGQLKIDLEKWGIIY